jgi:RNA polymerase sigma-70 factor (ECF subfamily)
VLNPGPSAASAAAEAAARRSYGKLVALLAAGTRDIAAAEDALAEAFAAALVDWPVRGVPAQPEAWLLTVARRKGIDALRQRRLHERSTEDLRLGFDECVDPWATAADLPDRRLGLMFACAHPAIDPAARAPLMLQAVLGFDAATIASAFLVARSAMGQRLVRAKAKIRQAGIALEVPQRDGLDGRLDAVLEAVYAAYAEGWTDAAGADARRRNLADEALWLGRLVAALMPSEPEALGLLALMLHAHARRAARRDEQGRYVPLSEQAMERWDGASIDEAEQLLQRAAACGRIGRFQLEAAVQSVHAARRRTGLTDWPAIERLYEALCELTGSPVAALNRAVARGQARGAAEGLAALEALSGEPCLAEYQPYWAARAEWLARCGQLHAAHDAYQRAIGLERDDEVRRFLQQRAAACLNA